MDPDFKPGSIQAKISNPPLQDTEQQVTFVVTLYFHISQQPCEVGRVAYYHYAGVTAEEKGGSVRHITLIPFTQHISDFTDPACFLESSYLN